ncbi:MAG: cbb3-type cytochrome c oxidase subunit [Devosia sp.]|nr:cbb3-type cytochrome c oxidase subunit [Devosia sp.]
MPKISNLFFKTAVLFLIVGIGMGLQMSISENHNVIGAHAHVNLLGWVSSAIFGVYYALNPAKAERRLALVHYAVYTTGVVFMSMALYLLLQGNTAVTPVVAVSSLIVVAGVLIFAWTVFAPENLALRRSARAV